MRKFNIEFTVGLFVIAGILCLGYLSIKLGGMEL
ncbi:MAG: outer membrane lipid asymmetry maintenance protein MlaD, partial [Deltaproteobacteria bacterium]|nr:outer membrane lipid asymmetry maintenance protein MlaD [Deltaproteobacteria bacterium]